MQSEDSASYSLFFLLLSYPIDLVPGNMEILLLFLFCSKVVRIEEKKVKEQIPKIGKMKYLGIPTGDGENIV